LTKLSTNPYCITLLLAAIVSLSEAPKPYVIEASIAVILVSISSLYLVNVDNRLLIILASETNKPSPRSKSKICLKFGIAAMIPSPFRACRMILSFLFYKHLTKQSAVLY
jgi:hypothetical protein